MDFDLPLGAPGVTLPDIGLRLYYGGAPTPVGAAVTLTQVSEIDYVLAGLPDVGPYRLTYDYPAGVWSSRSWGGPSTPREVIVPIRDGGLAGSLELALIVNGVTSALPLTVVEVGSPGDYRIKGWPEAHPGERWTLRWTYGDIHGAETWRHPALAVGTRLDLPDRTLSAFALAWRASTPPAGLAAMPHVVAKGGAWRPESQAAFVELDVLMDRGDEWGPVGMKGYDIPGLIQISIQVRDGDGTALLGQLVRIAAATLQGVVVQGLKCYGARAPYELHAPAAGYYGRAIDVPSRYVGP